MTLAELLRPFRGKEKADADLERLEAAANSGRTGVNLARMSDEEIIQRLSRR